MPYIAAFDAGTTAVKGALLDGSGRLAASGAAEIETLYDGERKEQRPEDWWAAFCAVARELTAAVDPAEITGISMSGQMQDLICLDEKLAPVRPAILYSDGRAEAQAERLAAAVGPERFLQITGNRCDGSLPLPKLMWLKEAEPETYRQVRHVLISSKDYLIARLTGACCGDFTACSTAGAMDIRKKIWSGELLSAADVEPSLFPRLLPSHGRAGAVLEGKDGGFLPGTPVYAGVGDAGATTLASGIARPGQYNINLGTSGWVATVSDDLLFQEAGVFNLAAMPEGRYINVVPFLNAGNVHKWICGLLAEGDYRRLGAALAQSCPGSGGVLFLPYLTGERFPVMAPEARGCFAGLTPQTTKADMARACLEGVAFSIRQGLEELPVPPESVSLIGGGCREAVWCQILVDVLGREVAVFKNAELLPAMAVASAALLAQGEIGSYEEFTAGLLSEDSSVRYMPEGHTRYDRQYRRFLRLYPAFRAALAL